MLTLVRHLLSDILRSRTVLIYAIILLVLTLALFQIESGADRATINLINVVLLVVPLFTLIFTITYYHNAQEFTQLLIVLPMPRWRVLLGEWLAVSTALGAAYTVGLGLPLLVQNPTGEALSLYLVGLALTLAFVGLSFLVVVFASEKIRGIGLGLTLWLFFAILYDGLLLMGLFLFSEYPIEGYVVPLASLNPIDLARIVVLLQFDLAALMGYTGAVYQQFFGSVQGILVASGLLLLWSSLPLLLAVHRFRTLDF